MAIKSLKEDIDSIKTTVDKIVNDGEKKDEGLKKLELAIHGIEKMLSETIPTLKFAKECIEECGGKEVMLNNLMMGLEADKRKEESRKRGNIPEFRRCAIKVA